MSKSLLDRMDSVEPVKSSSGTKRGGKNRKSKKNKKDGKATSTTDDKNGQPNLPAPNEPGPSQSRPKIEKNQGPSKQAEAITSAVTSQTRKQDFSSGDDFISFETESKQDILAKNHISSKHDLPPRPEGLSEKAAGKKRRWEEIDDNDEYMNMKQKVDVASRRCPWAADVDWEGCRNVAEMLNREVEAFLKYVSPTKVEHEFRSMIVQTISNCIEKAFPDAKVSPFGSYGTKLYLPSGDIDLVIQSKSMANVNKDSLLKTLANVVRRSGITDRVTIIAKAKVPIIKFLTAHGRISVDISINQLNGIEAGKMINRFLEELPALRAIVLVIKSFLNQRSMNEVFSGGLGSYSIVCLAVSFLQMHPKLRRGEIDPSKNLGVLVMEFFEFYGRYFNFQEVGISLRHGGTYFSKARRGWIDFRKPSLLSIEDPNDISNDISKGSFAINQVRQTFAGAFEILKTAAYVRASIISSRQQHRAVSLREGTAHNKLVPEEMSILSSVMGITQEIVNHRRLVQEVYDGGILHRLVGIELQRPESIVADIPKNNRNTPNRTLASQSVLASWEGEGNMEFSGEDERGSRRTADESYESESRYDIEAGSPSRKRRRTGKKKDSHIVYTADEDDDFSDASESDSLAAEEAHYDIDTTQSEPFEQKHVKPSRDVNLSAEGRRAYWISKGVDTEHDIEES